MFVLAILLAGNSCSMFDTLVSRDIFGVKWEGGTFSPLRSFSVPPMPPFDVFIS